MVKHVFADGSMAENITGHVVMMDQARAIYALLDEVRRKEEKNNVAGNKHIGAGIPGDE